MAEAIPGLSGGPDAHLLERIGLQYRIEQFYYAEATMLDDRRYEDWLNIFAEDAHYWMPIRRTRMNAEIDKEFSPPGAIAYFDDTKETLTNRVKKLRSGFSWSEDPPSRTRHLITNVAVTKDTENEVHVTANFHLYRARFDSEEDSWIGRRQDILRKTAGSFLISDRKIFLEQTVLLSRNLSNFF